MKKILTNLKALGYIMIGVLIGIFITALTMFLSTAWIWAHLKEILCK